MQPFEALKSVFWKLHAAVLSSGFYLIRRLPFRLTANEWRGVHLSFSQHGEDLLILHCLSNKDRKGIYVDVGAYDPVFFSNTLLLNKLGWRGINIDANRTRMARFRDGRPGDINICAAVSDRRKTVRYLHYPLDGTNRIEATEVGDLKNLAGELPQAIEELPTCTLTDILEQHEVSEAIDFLNVDCEGEDVNVLRGLDWQRWTPLVVAVEANEPTAERVIMEFLLSRGYSLIGKAHVTLIFARQASCASSSAT